MFGAVTPNFMFDLESNMRVISVEAYRALIAKMWWEKVAKRIPSKSSRELFFWMLDSATIEYTDEGNMQFEELAMQSAEYTIDYAAKGLKVLKSKLLDLDGNGVRMATSWSRQMGQYSAYFPQKHMAKALKAGETSKGYDGVNFFATNHPVHPLDASKGTYSNLLTTGIKLDDRHPLETAFETMKVIETALASIPMPNGEDPRNLEMGFFLAPPAMAQRLNLLHEAKYISMDGGSTDIEGSIARFGLKPPVIAKELGAAYGGSDTDCYLVVEEIAGDDIGPMVFIEREPFAIQYYTGADGGTGLDAILNRTREMEWHIQGRNAIRYGHPYKIFKLKGQAP